MRGGAGMCSLSGDENRWSKAFTHSLLPPWTATVGEGSLVKQHTEPIIPCNRLSPLASRKSMASKGTRSFLSILSNSVTRMTSAPFAHASCKGVLPKLFFRRRYCEPLMPPESKRVFVIRKWPFLDIKHQL